jgi:broad specificity phosphatase PhoE
MTPIVDFIRHGESESNAGLRTEHPGTSRLTEKGHRQAELTARSFATAPDLIVTSPYLRTRLTAEPLVQRFPQVPCAEWPVQEFTYLHPVNWKGTTWQERQPAAQAYWERLDPHYRDGEGAESWLDLIARIDQIRELILAQKVERLVIFSHGLFTRSFWWRMALPLLTPNIEAMRHYAHFIRGISFPNCGLLKFRFEQDDTWINGLSSAHLPEALLTH